METDDEITAKYVERENQLRRNFQIERQNDNTIYEKRLKDLKDKLNKVLPITTILHDLEMSYYKNPEFCNSDEFAILKKETLRFDKYQLGIQVYEVPKELITELPCVLAAYFDVNHEFHGFGTLTRRMNALNTFHTKYNSVCLGNDYASAKIVNFSIPETIVKGFEGMKKTLETTNPLSYLSSYVNPKLVPLKNFIDSQFKMWKKESGEYCNECDRLLEDCGCEDDESCSDCGSSDCGYCNDCEKSACECNCERCNRCHNRIESRDYDVCECEPINTIVTTGRD